MSTPTEIKGSQSDTPTPIVMNDLIDDVIAGRRTAEDAALHAHPYAVMFFEPSSPQEWTAMCQIREAYKALHPEPVAAPVARAHARPELKCRICGQAGYAGSHPFSTLPGSHVCDDCL